MMRAILVAALLGPLAAVTTADPSAGQTGVVQSADQRTGLPAAMRNVRTVRQVPNTAGAVSLSFVRYRFR